MNTKSKGMDKFRSHCTEFVGDNKPRIVLQIIILVACLLTCIIHDLSIAVGIIFFIFQFFVVYMQGKLFLSVMKIDLKDEIAEKAYCYGLGLVILIPEYYLLEFLHLGNFSQAIYLIAIVCTILYFYFKRKKIIDDLYFKRSRISDDAAKYGWTLCLFVLIFIYLVDFFTVSLVNTIPSENGVNGYYVDWLFWIGNAISFKKGLPVQNFRLVGVDFNYHYFSSVIIAQISRITGIDITIVGFYFSFIIVSIVMILSIYVFFSKFTDNKMILALAILITLFTGDRCVSAEWHYFYCPFGYDYGIAIGMLTMYYLFSRHVNEWRKRDVFISVILLGATTGLKSPIAVVILVAFGLEGLWLLWHKKLKTALIAGIGWLGVFLLTYKVVILSNHRNLTKTFYGIRLAFTNNIYGMDLYGKIVSITHFPNRLAKLIAFILYVFSINRAVLICFFIAFFIYLLRKEVVRYELVILLVMTLVGIYLTAALFMSGGSQMYFATAVLPYAVCFSIPAFDYIFLSKKSAINLVIAIVALFPIAYGFQHFSNLTLKLAWQGINTIEGNLNRDNYTDEYSYSSAGSYYITSDYVEVYEWVKNNTEENSVIAVPSYMGDMKAGVFSERFVWNDGTYCDYWIDEVNRRNNIINMLDNSETYDEGIELLKKEGVSYYLDDISVSEDSVLSKKLDKIYSNKVMAVYKVE